MRIQGYYFFGLLKWASEFAGVITETLPKSFILRIGISGRHWKSAMIDVHRAKERWLRGCYAQFKHKKLCSKGRWCANGHWTL